MTFNRRYFLALLTGLGGFTAFSACRQQEPLSPSTEQSLSLAATPVAPPAPPGIYAPPKGEIRLAIISDLNSQYGSTTYEPEVTLALRLLPQWQPDLVLCGGDMIAGQKRSLSVSQIKAMWAAFDRHIAAPLRQAHIPFGFTIGNHDGSGAMAGSKLSFAQERDLATAYWQYPAHDPGLEFVDRAGFPFYYTFRQKGIFYLVWDASTATIPKAVLNWAQQSLQSPPAQQASLRLAIGHLPLYAVAVGRDSAGNYLHNAETLQALLEKYQVHTYISGHHHAYYPGVKGQLELLHAGALGGGPRKLLNSSLPPRKTLTLLDITLAPFKIVDTTYKLPDLKVVDPHTLPLQIVAPNGTIQRQSFP